eukprot:GAHX01001536.1.p1 GENE.GAHX01001536.1~~GAHX01001536.1.p1  ORF type:complete len:422 (-),score=61.10 GAHX01001536.1:40-1305(-)
MIFETILICLLALYVLTYLLFTIIFIRNIRSVVFQYRSPGIVIGINTLLLALALVSNIYYLYAKKHLSHVFFPYRYIQTFLYHIAFLETILIRNIYINTMYYGNKQVTKKSNRLNQVYHFFRKSFVANPYFILLIRAIFLVIFTVINIINLIIFFKQENQGLNELLYEVYKYSIYLGILIFSIPFITLIFLMNDSYCIKFEFGLLSLNWCLSILVRGIFKIITMHAEKSEELKLEHTNIFIGLLLPNYFMLILSMGVPCTIIYGVLFKTEYRQLMNRLKRFSKTSKKDNIAEMIKNDTLYKLLIETNQDNFVNEYLIFLKAIYEFKLLYNKKTDFENKKTAGKITVYFLKERGNFIKNVVQKSELKKIHELIKEEKVEEKLFDPFINDTLEFICKNVNITAKHGTIKIKKSVVINALRKDE